MNYETKELNDHRLEIMAEIDEEMFNKAKISAAKNISKESKFSGFRPGKAPMDVVKRIYGDKLIEERAIEITVKQIYPDLINKLTIKPYGPGQLEEVITINPLKIRFSVPLAPEIKLSDYKSIRHPYVLPKVEQKDIQQVIENLQLNYSTAEETNKKSEKGDLISVRINAVLLNPDKDQDVNILTDTPHQTIIGHQSEEEQFPYPGFSEQLIGLSAGDIKEVRYKYRKDSTFENLRNKDVSFSIKVENVKELNKPVLNDDFAKTVGFETLNQLEESIKDQIETANKNDYENSYFGELLNKIASKAKIKYPPQMVDDEVKDVLRNFVQELANRNLDFETYLKLNKREENEFIEKEIRPAAIKRLEHALVLEEINRLEKIELDQTDLHEEFTRTYLQLKSDPNYKRLQKEFTTKKLSNALIMQSATRLMNRRTLERIKAIANNELVANQDAQNHSNQPIENSNKKLIHDK